MKIGARIVKTGIAVSITMYLCKFFQLEPAFFGAVSAVVNMQPSLFLTVKTAKDQVVVHLIAVGLGLLFGYLLGGAVVIETIFSLPGMGKLMIDAVQNGDPAVVQGVVLTTATGFVVVNLVIDILYLLVNPRLRAA